ncbi:MAG: hypothetical protein AAF292_08530 [Pseudomonadota bacterium]
MPFEYISTEDAIASDGLRMVVVGNVPSPWGEAAKGLLHMKGLKWSAVRLAYDDPALADWAGELSGPIAVYNDEAPRSGWADILLLVERLAPEPALVPDDLADRALMFGLCHELLGEQGLAWSRRLQQVHIGLSGEGGFDTRVAHYLAGKYGHTPELGDAAGSRTISLLGLFSDRLKAQQSAGSHYYIGDTLSAVDVYSAAVMALFAPLPEEQCAMNPTTRSAFESLDDATRAALDPALIAHRDIVYARHLELPLSL